MSNIDLPLLRQVQHDIEEYLNIETASEKINDTQAFILIYYVYTCGMGGFLSTVAELLEHTERTYNEYLKTCVLAIKRRFTANKQCYKLPRHIDAVTVVQVLHDIENTLSGRYNWDKIAEELEGEELSYD